jgi:hypothetical protein
MADFKDILDLASLDDHEIGHIEFVLNSPAYGDHFAPYLKRQRDTLNKLLLDPSGERETRYPSDFLRGGIIMIDGLLELFEKLIHETRIERMARSQVERTPNEQYQQMREEGLVRHSGQTVQPAEPGIYDPAEDY